MVNFFGSVLILISGLLSGLKLVAGEDKGDFTYVKPFPELPKFVDPSTVQDAFTIALLSQVHATLFRIDSFGQPEEFAVDSFSVSRDQLTYSFQLKRIKFHDDTPLRSHHVKSSIENAIRNRCSTWMALSSIEGFEKIANGESKNLSGIELSDSHLEFKIKLEVPDPKLIHKLADVNYAIWKVDPAKVHVGLGPYQVESQSKSQIEVVRSSSGVSAPPAAPGRIRFVQMEQTEALQAILSNEVHDLFLYPISKLNIKAVGAAAHTQKTVFPRVYFLAINSRRWQERDERNTLLASVNRKTLIDRCFPGEEPATGIVPPGFIGHGRQADLEVASRQKMAPKTRLRSKKFKVAITKSIGSEDCIGEQLSSQLGQTLDVEVEHMTLSEVVEAWLNNEVDGLVAYLDGESTANYFGPFDPSAHFSYGDPKDESFSRLYSRFEREEDPGLKDLYAGQLGDHILELRTFLPLFQPSVYLVYSKKLAELPTSFLATSTFQMEFMRLQE